MISMTEQLIKAKTLLANQSETLNIPIALKLVLNIFRQDKILKNYKF